MLSTWAFLAVVAGCFLYTDAVTVHKCDQAVVDKVKALGENPGVLPELVTFGTMIIVKMTEKYFESDVACKSIKIYQEEGVIKEFVHIKLKQKGHDRDKTLEVVESDGSFTDKETDLIRYDVYSKKSVFATYICSNSDQAATGPPIGFAAVGPGFTQETLDEALAALKSVGVAPTETYPNTCPT